MTIKTYSEGDGTIDEVRIVEAEIKYELGIQEYYILPSGSLERWQYSYDGNGKKLFAIVDNSNEKMRARYSFNKSLGYVSVVRLGHITRIEIRDVATGNKVFETDTLELSRRLYGTDDVSAMLRSGFDSVAYWKDKKGKEYFEIELEGFTNETYGRLEVAKVDMETWTY
ncbi:MAG: hypothetical protein A3J67_00910 [Parcubacteria group bacterium RIFCSPHIGHO2_02_FULL_48_10b]|nr:MAG: hypothetical protein A3J67_00910 [Parcubacteria group bacterium RIFCSPHIGHO2_02_FULL_48_10b]